MLSLSWKAAEARPEQPPTPTRSSVKPPPATPRFEEKLINQGEPMAPPRGRKKTLQLLGCGVSSPVRSADS